MSQHNPYGGPPQEPNPYGQPGPGGPPPGGPPQGPPPGWNPGTGGYGAGPAQPGYAFGPFAPGPGPNPYGPGPGQPNPGQPNPAGGPPAAPPARRRTKLPLIIGAGALVLVLAVIGAVALVNRDDPEAGPGPTTSAPGPSSSTPTPAAAATASDAVNGYLQAVAAGNTATALAYGMSPVDDDSLLSAKVVAEARKRAPVTAIDVPAVDDPNASTVPARYLVGKTQVDKSFPVRKVQGEWKLVNVAAEIDLSILRSGSVPLLINGQKVTSDTVYALPGGYSFSTGNKYLSYGSTSALTIKTPADLPNTAVLDVSITKAGKKAVIAATKKNFTNCLKAHSLKPKGCPFRLSDNGYKIRTSTIKWKRTGADPFKNPKVRFFDGDASINIKYKLSVTASCSGYSSCNGSTRGNNTAYLKLTDKTLKPKWVL